MCEQICFMCSSSTAQRNLRSKTTTLSSWPSNNLDVIYLLRNLLRVPKSLLVAHLRKCGNNPDSWISLCVQCIQLIRRARSLPQEIRKIEKELISIQEQVLDKIRGPRGTNDNHRNNEKSKESFPEKVKLLVRKHTPLNSKNDDDNPPRLLEGDQVARRLAIQKSPSKSKPLVENTATATVPEEIKEEELPSPAGMSPEPPPEVPSSSPGEPQITSISTMTTTTATKNFHPGFAKRFHCSECGKAFTFARFWAEHLLKLHNIRDITCPGQGCSEKFNDDLIQFQDHWKATHLTWSGRRCPCTICGKEFKNAKSYANHMRNKHLSKKPTKQHFICDICGIETNTYGGWYQHRRNKHQEIMGKTWKSSPRKPYKPIKQILKSQLCQLCGKTIKGKGNLRNHMRIVHEKRFNHSCHVCGIGMAAPINLKFHLLTSHKDDPVTKRLEEEEGIRLWKCGIVGCGLKFLFKDKLDKHVEKFHKDGQDGERRYKCKFCGRGFWSRQKLRWHEDIHEAKVKQDWKCEVCEKGFATEIYLKYHLKHTHKLSNKVEDK